MVARQKNVDVPEKLSDIDIAGFQLQDFSPTIASWRLPDPH
jgi:hypothetical protein